MLDNYNKAVSEFWHFLGAMLTTNLCDSDSDNQPGKVEKYIIYLFYNIISRCNVIWEITN